jgi:hypothetical protein
MLLMLLICDGCTRDKAGSASAAAYTSDSGSELEAPRLIPAIQNQLNLMASGVRPTDPENLTAYRNLGVVSELYLGDAERALTATASALNSTPSLITPPASA